MREYRLEDGHDWWWIVGKPGEIQFMYLHHEETEYTPRKMTPFTSFAARFYTKTSLETFMRKNQDFTPYLVRAEITPIYLPWGTYD